MLHDERTFAKLAAVALFGAAAVISPSPARASSPYLVVPDASVAERSPAFRYANLSDDDAYSELDRRKILYLRAGPLAGVRAPVRLTGRLHGVWFHSSLPADERQHSLFEVLDARLALALDDFAAVLERHDIDEVVHYTMYRPSGGAPDHHGVVGEIGTVSSRGPQPAHAPTAKHAARSTRPTKVARRIAPASSREKGSRGAASPARPVVARASAAPPGTRHPAGLAIDVGAVHKRDGRWINVGSQFHGRIGDRTCGAGARVPEEPDARELRSMVCEASDLGVFTYVLTPNYNAAHADHFHMEIKPGVHWFLYN